MGGPDSRADKHSITFRAFLQPPFATERRLLSDMDIAGPKSGGPESTQLGGSGLQLSESGMGQNDQFPPANLSAGFGFSKQTLAGARGNEEVAPILLKKSMPRPVLRCETAAPLAGG